KRAGSFVPPQRSQSQARDDCVFQTKTVGYRADVGLLGLAQLHQILLGEASRRVACHEIGHRGSIAQREGGACISEVSKPHRTTEKMGYPLLEANANEEASEGPDSRSQIRCLVIGGPARLGSRSSNPSAIIGAQRAKPPPTLRPLPARTPRHRRSVRGGVRLHPPPACRHAVALAALRRRFGRGRRGPHRLACLAERGAGGASGRRPGRSPHLWLSLPGHGRPPPLLAPRHLPTPPLHTP